MGENSIESFGNYRKSELEFADNILSNIDRRNVAEINASSQHNLRMMEIDAKSRKEREERQIIAAEKTAENTSTTNEMLEKVINNQNEYIDLLKNQLETSEKALKKLSELFYSSEDSVSVEKEIMKIIQADIDDKHPIKDALVEKGIDISVDQIAAIVPFVIAAIQQYLLSQGILIP